MSSGRSEPDAAPTDLVPGKFLARAAFCLSAARLAQLPPDATTEVAFAGRSNAGKSSAINALTQRRALARVSKTPGRTRQINFFALDPSRYLVDLPGYGFAKVSRAERMQWAQLVEQYLLSRQVLRGLVVLMDIRRPFTNLDQQLIDWALAAGVDFHLVLTKADKLSRARARTELELARRSVETLGPGTVQLFSATTRIGLAELQDKVYRWLTEDP